MKKEIQHLSQQVIQAGLDSKVLRIIGSASKSFYANSTCLTNLAGKSIEPLSTLNLRGDIVYEPTELVVTAPAATPLKELTDLLHQSHQYLPFDPPYFGPNATVGGMVASGFSGPSRASVGGVRDYVLGVHLLNGKGELLEFGGQVMKNVAGYDVSRLLAGSFGQVGLITQVSLKVLPLPLAQACLVFEYSQAHAISQLNHWAGLPLPIQASCWVQDQGQNKLYIQLAGAKAAVESACNTMGGVQLDWPTVAPDWVALREQSLGFFELENNECLWRLSVPDTTGALAHDYPTLLEWGGALRWVKAPLSAHSQLQEMVGPLGGQVSLWKLSADQSALQNPLVYLPRLSTVQHKIQTQLLQQLDPLGVFQTGRIL
jgi:glycolate oxidase FAD binding subunit